MEFILSIIDPVLNINTVSYFKALLLLMPIFVILGFVIYLFLGAFKDIKDNIYLRILTSFVILICIWLVVALKMIGVSFDQIMPLLVDWMDLIFRWVHIIVGIAWIGTSFYFNWLDSRLDRETKNETVEGELWSVHSGGFYNITKLKGPPKEFPKELHWFKWEAYTTWISGFVLLVLVYYLNVEGFMLNSNINNISPTVAIITSILFLFGSWFLYDSLCKSNLINNTVLFSTICLLIAVVASYFLTIIYESRAAYIHIGASLGTIMAANVFRVIIPSQKNMVNAALSNSIPDLKQGINAKTRSIHNNYMTLPVLFIMISSHYPFTYGHKYNWVLLALISLIGASVRHYFNLRNRKKYKPWILPVAAMAMFLLFFYTSIPKMISFNRDAQSTYNTEEVSFNEVYEIIKYRCGVCHATNPSFEGIEDPPLGVIYDHPEDILRNVFKIKTQAVDTNIMPPANITGITPSERKKIADWINQGANINN